MRRLRILVVEDDGLVAMLIEDLLDEFGCDLALSAASVAQAIRWLDEGGQADAALLDVNLGGEMVWPVADALRARRTPFAFTSGYGALSEPRFQDAPLLAKPILSERLEEVLRAFAGEA
jgi:CheY-like chemotaxis protein